MQDLDAARRLPPSRQIAEIGLRLHPDDLSDGVLDGCDRLEDDIDGASPHQAQIDGPLRKNVAQDQVGSRARLAPERSD